MSTYWNFTVQMVAGTLAKAEDINVNLAGIDSAFTLVEQELSHAIQVTSAPGVTEIPLNAAARAGKVLAFDALGDISATLPIGDYRGDHADAAGTDYFVRDLVKDAAGAVGLDNIYICKTAHTSTGGLDLDIANFDLIVDAFTATAAAVSASASAAAAAASYDAFDDRYLGSKAVAPTLDNDGNALLDGAIYWDSVTSDLYFYELGTTTWKAATSAPHTHTSFNNAINFQAPIDLGVQATTGGVLKLWRGDAGETVPHQISATASWMMLTPARESGAVYRYVVFGDSTTTWKCHFRSGNTVEDFGFFPTTNHQGNIGDSFNRWSSVWADGMIADNISSNGSVIIRAEPPLLKIRSSVTVGDLSQSIDFENNAYDIPTATYGTRAQIGFLDQTTDFQISNVEGSLVLNSADSVYLIAEPVAGDIIMSCGGALSINGALVLDSSNVGTYAAAPGHTHSAFTNLAITTTLTVGGNDVLHIGGGQTLNGDLDFINSAKIKMGATNDLQLYSNGTAGYIQNHTGPLSIEATQEDATGHLRAQNTENVTKTCLTWGNGASDEPSVFLFYDEVEKFRTTAAGVLVSGDIHIGEASTAASGTLYLNGTTAGKQSYITCTDGTLHMNSAAGSPLLLNGNTGSAVQFGNGAGGVAASISQAALFIPATTNAGQIGDASYVWDLSYIRRGYFTDSIELTEKASGYAGAAGQGVLWAKSSTHDLMYVANGVEKTIPGHEVGSFTTSITTDTGTVTLNASWDDFRYVKIGQLVHLHGRLTISAVSSPTGGVRIALPFAIEAPPNKSSSVPVIVENWGSSPGSYEPALVMTSSNGYVFLELYDPLSTTYLPAAGYLKAGTNIEFSLTYITNVQ